jgi:hypothetical protein
VVQKLAGKRSVRMSFWRARPPGSVNVTWIITAGRLLASTWPILFSDCYRNPYLMWHRRHNVAVDELPTDVHTESVRDVGIRDSMLRLPGILQQPLTFLTGKPHKGQRPLKISPTGHFVLSVFSTVIGIAIGVFALLASGWALVWLLVSWAVVLHAMRNLRMVIFHQCAHQVMWRSRPAFETAVGEVTAGLVMVQSFRRYRVSHRVDHHGTHHMTPRDPTVHDFLVGLRLQPGMSRRQMWRRILVLLVSPWFHVRFMISRLKSAMLYGSSTQRVTTAGVPLAFAVWGIWQPAAFIGYLVLWLLPVSVFFQISAVLRLCVKHSFPPPGMSLHDRASIAALTGGVFVGDRLPRPAGALHRRAMAYALWTVRLLAVHFPVRYLVLTGDAVCHDFHHRRPMSRDWSNYIFARQADQDAGHPGWPPYHEAWNLVPAMNRVLDSLREADPTIYAVANLNALPAHELYNSFDD